MQDNLRWHKTGGFRRISAERPFGDVISPDRLRRRARNRRPSVAETASIPASGSSAQRSLSARESILDPFAGSGSTLAAANAVGYTSVGIEMDPKYIKVAKKAIEAQFTSPDRSSLTAAS